MNAINNFGPYQLVSRLAMGGMAEIWRARKLAEAGFEKQLVIKRILPHYGDDEEFQRMFFDEARIAALLVHPNIVSVYDFGQHEGIFFIAMEYVEGFDLRRIMRQAQISGVILGPNRAAQIARAIAAGLSYAHTRSDGGAPLGIVHRDISPHNVLISMDGHVKVMDFGIAKASAKASRTRTGVIKGKIAYMAPEQARGEDTDARADIFSTGVVLWELLAGRRLFEGDHEQQILERVKACEIPSLGAWGDDAPEELLACLHKMLAASPDDRYTTMREAERDLGKIIHQMGGAEDERLDDFVQAVIPDEWLARQRQEHTQQMPKSFSTSAETRPKSFHTATGSGDEVMETVVEARAHTEASIEVPATRLMLPARKRRALLPWLVALSLALLFGAAALQTWLMPRAPSAAVVLLPPEPASQPAAMEAPAPSPTRTSAPTSAPTPEPPRAFEAPPVRAQKPRAAPSATTKAAAALAQAGAKTGRVNFVQCPAGSKVRIDGKLRALGERKELELPVGLHRLQVENADGAAFASSAVDVREDLEAEYDCGS